MNSNNGKLITLINECCDNIDNLLDKLDVKYYKNCKRIYGACPVHCGDNQSAWNLYPDGEVMRGYWQCYTHHCEKKYKSSLIGLVRGILSNRNNYYVTAETAINWMLKFCGYNSIEHVKESHKKKQDIIINTNIKNNTVNKKLTREYIRSKMDEIPAKFFTQKKYSPEILDRYDIGYVRQLNRVVVPIYDSNYQYAIGFAKRTVLDKCKKCGYYHSGKCPENKYMFTKWTNSKGFSRESTLYNLWSAKKYVRETNTIILVEGPGDVWRMEEAGIHNSVAIFGTSLTNTQKILIDMSWAINVILMLDNDNAGKNGKIDIYNTLKRGYNVIVPSFDKKDVGEMTVEEIKKIAGRLSCI